MYFDEQCYVLFTKKNNLNQSEICKLPLNVSFFLWLKSELGLQVDGRNLGSIFSN
jgi:hypothetical protein